MESEQTGSTREQAADGGMPPLPPPPEQPEPPEREEPGAERASPPPSPPRPSRLNRCLESAAFRDWIKIGVESALVVAAIWTLFVAQDQWKEMVRANDQVAVSLRPVITLDVDHPEPHETGVIFLVLNAGQMPAERVNVVYRQMVDGQPTQERRQQATGLASQDGIELLVSTPDDEPATACGMIAFGDGEARQCVTFCKTRAPNASWTNCASAYADCGAVDADPCLVGLPVP